MGFQLVLEAELLPAAITFIGFLPGVDAFVTLQRALVSEAAPAELAFIRVIARCNVEREKDQSIISSTNAEQQHECRNKRRFDYCTFTKPD